MKNEKILKIIYPKDKLSELWPIIITDENNYLLKAGGYKKIHSNLININSYTELQVPFIGSRIGKQFTDEENIYIFIEDKYIIESGLLEPNFDSNFYNYDITFYDFKLLGKKLKNDSEVFEIYLSEKSVSQLKDNDID